MPNSIGDILQELVAFESRKRLLRSRTRIWPPGPVGKPFRPNSDDGRSEQVNQGRKLCAPHLSGAYVDIAVPPRTNCSRPHLGNFMSRAESCFHEARRMLRPHKR
jgi:hypothetical protein